MCRRFSRPRFSVSAGPSSPLNSGGVSSRGFSSSWTNASLDVRIAVTLSPVGPLAAGATPRTPRCFWGTPVKYALVEVGPNFTGLFLTVVTSVTVMAEPKTWSRLSITGGLPCTSSCGVTVESVPAIQLCSFADHARASNQKHMGIFEWAIIALAMLYSEPMIRSTLALPFELLALVYSMVPPDAAISLGTGPPT